ncbi:DNA-methyltransferase [Spiroplasma ixodetis]|uniref:DNA-methyltransferase n=1 Tax=Spiroplasma ixodetis TaxID=2141 RepID=UPI00257812CC|nr:site-specific DNA-methyltransferase [Spiroplasma ixodetis]WJG70436.1 site-specific DNA-methyltransferase (adenine-specific) [Spiroplasma ixodetis Y32]
MRLVSKELETKNGKTVKLKIDNSNSNQVKKINLIFGDSFVEMKKMKNELVDFIFIDPPYFLSNNGYSVNAGKRTSVNKGEWDKSKGFLENYKFHQKWIKECKRILKPNGTLIITGTYHSIYICGFILQELNFHILNDIAWYKPNCTPNIGCRNFTASHETLIWAKKDSNSKHVFNYKDMKYSKWEEDNFKNEDKQMRSVWAITTPKPFEKNYGKHPSQKPLDLLKRIIIACTNENDIVLDPFMGSGTTGLACKIHNRNFIGIENNIEYFNLATKRLDDNNG